MKRRGPAIALVASLTLGMALAACGQSDSGNTSRKTERPMTQGISADKVITLGTWVPRSGPLAGVGSSPVDGGKMAFDEANAAGGINGYKIELKEIDDGADPTRTVGAVRTLWSEDKVFGLFMPYGSGPNQAARQYVLDNKIPTFFPYANAAIYFPEGQKPPAHVFGFYPPYGSLVAQLAEFVAKNKGVKKIAVFHTQDQYGQAGADGAKAAAAKLGLELVADIGYDSGETNYAPIGRKVAATGADAIFAWAIPGATKIMEAAQQAGFKGYWLVQSGLFGKTAEAQMQAMPDIANKAFLSNFQLMRNDGNDDVTRFIEQFAAKYPKADPDLALQGYSNAKVLIEAISRATAGGKELTVDSLIKSFESIKDFSTVAAAGVSYSENSHFGSVKGRVYVWDGQHYKAVTEFETLPGLVAGD